VGPFFLLSKEKNGSPIVVILRIGQKRLIFLVAAFSCRKREEKGRYVLGLSDLIILSAGEKEGSSTHICGVQLGRGGEGVCLVGGRIDGSRGRGRLVRSFFAGEELSASSCKVGEGASWVAGHEKRGLRYNSRVKKRKFTVQFTAVSTGRELFEVSSSVLEGETTSPGWKKKSLSRRLDELAWKRKKKKERKKWLGV